MNRNMTKVCYVAKVQLASHVPLSCFWQKSNYALK